MEMYLKIGKTIIQKFSDYADENPLDEESEYFPVLKIIIDGVVECCDESSQNRESIKKDLIDFARKRYVESCLQKVHEYQNEPDIVEETNEAIETFNDLFLYGTLKKNLR